MSKVIEYCYSIDEEFFNLDHVGEVIEHLDGLTDDLIGHSYWRGEKVALQYNDCIDIEGFLEQCDENAYEHIGEVYDSCFTDVTPEEKAELKEKILNWCEKRVNLRFWNVKNVVELKITAEDIKEYL